MDRAATFAVAAIAAIIPLLTQCTKAKPPERMPTASTIPTTRSATAKAATAPADFPDLTDESHPGLEFRMHADTIAKLIKQAKPDFVGTFSDQDTSESILPDDFYRDRDFLRIMYDSNGDPVFHIERAFAYRAGGKDKPTQWVLVKNRKDYEQQSVDCVAMPATLHVVKALDGRGAALLGADPKWGKVYQLQWDAIGGIGSGMWERTWYIYVWQDANRKWHMIGTGMEGVTSAREGWSSVPSAQVRWQDGKPQVLLMMTIDQGVFIGEDTTRPDLQTRRDASLQMTIAGRPGKYVWNGGEYLLPEKADTLDRIATRMAIWRTTWPADRDKNAQTERAKLIQSMRALLQAANRDVDWSHLKPHQRINVPTGT